MYNVEFTLNINNSDLTHPLSAKLSEAGLKKLGLLWRDLRGTMVDPFTSMPIVIEADGAINGDGIGVLGIDLTKVDRWHAAPVSK